MGKSKHGKNYYIKKDKKKYYILMSDHNTAVSIYISSFSINTCRQDNRLQ